MPKTYFNCVLCGDLKFEAYPRWIDDSRICDECAEDCVVPRFHDALKHEHNYPPKWGNVVMDVWTFWDLFDGKFLDAWREKLREYAEPVKSRLYCEHRSGADGVVCGAFLGTKGSGAICCLRCRGCTCRRCGTGTSDIGSANNHRCHEMLKEDPFENLSKGQDYQQCPGCKKEIVLSEGCNHMICISPCDTHFCFFCGQKVAARRSGHWQKGKCPRFGVAGRRLIWDNDGEHSVADSEEYEFDAEIRAQDLAELDVIEDLIETFDQAAEAEDFEDNRARFTRTPWSTRRESRASFFRYISLNLAIVLQAKQSAFDLTDAADILQEFNNRDRGIVRRLRLYMSETHPQAGGPTELSDLRDQLNAYAAYAIETRRDLAHIVEQEAGRAAR